MEGNKKFRFKLVGYEEKSGVLAESQEPYHNYLLHCINYDDYHEKNTISNNGDMVIVFKCTDSVFQDLVDFAISHKREDIVGMYFDGYYYTHYNHQKLKYPSLSKVYK